MYHSRLLRLGTEGYIVAEEAFKQSGVTINRLVRSLDCDWQFHIKFWTVVMLNGIQRPVKGSKAQLFTVTTHISDSPAFPITLRLVFITEHVALKSQILCQNFFKISLYLRFLKRKIRRDVGILNKSLISLEAFHLK